MPSDHVARRFDHDENLDRGHRLRDALHQAAPHDAPGAADVRVFGERRISMRIWLDPAKLAAYRVTPADVEDALRRQNVEIPAGRIESNQREFPCSRRPTCRHPRNSTPL
jgi:multidrug efflux pump subunit AcrB